MFAAFTHVDGWLNSALPAALCVAIWAVLAGVISMLLYEFCSPQQRLRALGEQIRDVQRAMSDYTGDFAGMRDLTVQNLKLALQRVWLAVLPAVVAGLPVLLIILGVGMRYANTEPRPGDTVRVAPTPADAELAWSRSDRVTHDETTGCWDVVWPDSNAPVIAMDTEGNELFRLPPAVSQSVCTADHWWEPPVPRQQITPEASAGLTSVAITGPPREMFSFGPGWMRSWLTMFLCASTVSALALKQTRGLA